MRVLFALLAVAVALPVCCWRGERLADGLNHPGRAAKVALACGVASRFSRAQRR